MTSRKTMDKSAPPRSGGSAPGREPRLVMAAFWLSASDDDEASERVAEAVAGVGAIHGHGAVVSFGRHPPRRLLAELERYRLQEASQSPAEARQGEGNMEDPPYSSAGAPQWQGAET